MANACPHRFPDLRLYPVYPRYSFLLTVGAVYADVVLFAQIVGMGANLLWFFEINTSDTVAFLYVGGDFAGLLAYFGCFLFGFFHFLWAPGRFWYGLHPLNLGIALILLSSHRLWAAQWWGLVAAVLVGGGLAWAGKRWFNQFPRGTMIFIVAVFAFGRLMLPREWLSAYLACGLGAVLIFLPIVLYRWHPPANPEPTAEKT